MKREESNFVRDLLTIPSIALAAGFIYVVGSSVYTYRKNTAEARRIISDFNQANRTSDYRSMRRALSEAEEFSHGVRITPHLRDFVGIPNISPRAYRELRALAGDKGYAWLDNTNQTEEASERGED